MTWMRSKDGRPLKRLNKQDKMHREMRRERRGIKWKAKSNGSGRRGLIVDFTTAMRTVALSSLTKILGK